MITKTIKNVIQKALEAGAEILVAIIVVYIALACFVALKNLFI
jgi:hypothetical protein